MTSARYPTYSMMAGSNITIVHFIANITRIRSSEEYDFSAPPKWTASPFPGAKKMFYLKPDRSRPRIKLITKLVNVCKVDQDKRSPHWQSDSSVLASHGYRRLRSAGKASDAIRNSWPLDLRRQGFAMTTVFRRLWMTSTSANLKPRLPRKGAGQNGSNQLKCCLLREDPFPANHLYVWKFIEHPSK